MTKEELNKLCDLADAVTSAEIHLTNVQNTVNNAMARRDCAKNAYRNFLATVATSDEAPVKRAYVRKAKALLDSATNAAQPTNEAVRERIAQPSLSGLPDENGAGE